MQDTSQGNSSRGHSAHKATVKAGLDGALSYEHVIAEMRLCEPVAYYAAVHRLTDLHVYPILAVS